MNILLTGGSGTLGKAIRLSKKFSSILTPTHKELDITNSSLVQQYFKTHSIDAIIHCAALARMATCQHNPSAAIATNVGGTMNLVSGCTLFPSPRFIYISTDGVYAGVTGNYAEHDTTMPYNTYGHTKIAAEHIVQLLNNYCILRTSFFDTLNIRFEDAATDHYSSKIPIQDLVDAIKILLHHDYIGIVNVGGTRVSDYELYKKYKPSIIETTLSIMNKNIPFILPPDSSMNCNVWNNLVRNLK